MKVNPADAVLAYCRQRGYPEPDFEVRFHPARKFAFDVAWRDEMLALEFEGGTFGKGRPCPVCRRRPPAGHGGIDRMKRDHEKYTLAAALGWRVMHQRPEQAASGEVFRWLDMVFGGKP